MKIINQTIQRSTKGNPDLIDITEAVAAIVNKTKLANGSVLVFVVGSTAAITTFEYEPGLIQDVQELFGKLVPGNRHYRHDETWGDANGFSHLLASLAGPSLVIPFKDSKLQLGTWQQVVLAEFDNRPRQRTVIVQVSGE